MITLVLPVLDEAGALPWILERAGGLPGGAAVVVADNGSRDGSQELARRLGARVIDVPRRGYGAAVHAGVEAAETQVVAVIDADATFDPMELAPLVAAVESGLDMAVCRRRPESGQAWPWHGRAGTAFIAWRLRSKTGLPVHDLAPARVFRRREYLELGITDRAFGYPVEVFTRAADAGWEVDEFDMTYRERVGKSKVTGSVRGSLRATRQLLCRLP